jgi:hypothetical protein
MTDKWVPLRPQENIEKTLSHFISYEGACVGWCLVCDQPIRSDADMISGTNSHDCLMNRLIFSGAITARK